MKNTIQILYIIGSFQGFFLVLLLLLRKKNTLANKVLALLILLLSINMTATFFHTDHGKISDLAAINRSDFFICLYGPLIAFYFILFTGLKEKLSFKYFIHLSPGVILMVFYILKNTCLSKSFLWDSNNPITVKSWYIITLLTFAHFLIYIIIGFVTVSKFGKRLSLFFSQNRKIYLLWLRTLLIGFVLVWLFAVLQFFIHGFDPEGLMQWIVSVTSILLIFIMGFFINRQPNLLQNLKDMNNILSSEYKSEYFFEEPKVVPEESEDRVKQEKYRRNRLDEAEEKKNLSQLLEYVKENKPYLETDLNLKQLSEGVGIPAHQLSMLLSIYIGQNFYNFINKYRIEEAKKRLLSCEGKEHNILTIAYETGFNSKSTFNSVFKKFEGITPSQFRDETKT